ncbi:DUF2231 domain-containing protein [Mesorhizobium sp. M0618]|uniref:DUF2231 domain-containing protein n=1 Tax=unclassified Mesorhizobium TaxID=325217 RepID=UPI00333CC80D
MARARSVLVAARRPFHKTPMAVANACFVGTLLTDVAYWRSAEMMWADFSAWLLLAGLVVGVLAVLAALVDLFTGRLSGEAGRVWPYLLGSLVVLVVSSTHWCTAGMLGPRSCRRGSSCPPSP